MPFRADLGSFRMTVSVTVMAEDAGAAAALSNALSHAADYAARQATVTRGRTQYGRVPAHVWEKVRRALSEASIDAGAWVRCDGSGQILPVRDVRGHGLPSGPFDANCPECGAWQNFEVTNTSMVRVPDHQYRQAFPPGNPEMGRAR